MEHVTTLPIIPIGHKVVWVIIDQLPKSAYFIPLNDGCSLEKLAQTSIKEIIRFHGMLVSIVFNGDLQFVS